MIRLVAVTALLLSASAATGACLNVGQAQFAREEELQNGMEQVH